MWFYAALRFGWMLLKTLERNSKRLDYVNPLPVQLETFEKSMSVLRTGLDILKDHGLQLPYYKTFLNLKIWSCKVVLEKLKREMINENKFDSSL